MKNKSSFKNIQLIKNKSIVLPKIRMKGPLMSITENINQSAIEHINIKKTKEIDYSDLNKGEVFIKDSNNEEMIKYFIKIIEKQIDVS